MLKPALKRGLRRGKGAGVFLERVREEALEEGPGGVRVGAALEYAEDVLRHVYARGLRAGQAGGPAVGAVEDQVPEPELAVFVAVQAHKVEGEARVRRGLVVLLVREDACEDVAARGLVRRAEVGVEPAAGEAVAVPERVKERLARPGGEGFGLRHAPGQGLSQRPGHALDLKVEGQAAQLALAAHSLGEVPGQRDAEPAREIGARLPEPRGGRTGVLRQACGLEGGEVHVRLQPTVHGVHELRGALEAQQLHGPFRPRGVIVLRRPGYPLVRARHGEDQGLRPGRLLRLRRRALRRGLSAAGRKRQD